jgi:nucleolar protein 56
VQPFVTAENALVNINDISEGIVNSDLRGFLESNLPAVVAPKPGMQPLLLMSAVSFAVPPLPRVLARAGKSPKWVLGVAEPKIGTAIQEGMGIPCNSNDTVAEIVRGARMHLTHYIPQLAGGNWQKAQLGLAHSYSRAKVKFNVNRSDNMIIQVRGSIVSATLCRSSMRTSILPQL